MTDIEALIAVGRAQLAATGDNQWFVRDNDLIGGTCVMNVDRWPSEVGASAIVADTADEAQAEAIAWMRNNLGALLDGLERVICERDDALAVLERFRVDTQADYQAIRARQQRDAETIAKLRAGEAA